MKKETTNNKKVFFEEIQVCNNGTARYLFDLARVDKYSVTRDFAAAFCKLPTTYKTIDYKAFIDSWGTVSEQLTIIRLSLSESRQIFPETSEANNCFSIIFRGEYQDMQNSKENRK